MFCLVGNESKESAKKLFEKENRENLKEEIGNLSEFFTTMVTLVDMNLNYLPEIIIVTFGKHQDVLNVLGVPFFDYDSQLDKKAWKLATKKVNFITQVRNPESSNAETYDKFMPPL